MYILSKANKPGQIAVALLSGLLFTYLSYFVGLHYGWITPENINYFELVAVVFNYWCVFLVIAENNATWVTGITASLILSVVFYQYQLYSSMVLNLLYFVPVQFFGWWVWKYGGKNNKELRVSTMTLEQWIYVLLLAGPSWYGIVKLNEYFGGASPMLDTGILVMSVLAQMLLSYKKVESWYLWTVVNVLSIYVYVSTGAFVVGLQYAFFLINSIAGIIIWSAENEEQNKPLVFGRLNK